MGQEALGVVIEVVFGLLTKLNDNVVYKVVDNADIRIINQVRVVYKPLKWLVFSLQGTK